eukprot:15430165-Alexandrium_andersonii.AAC.1
MVSQVRGRAAASYRAGGHFGINGCPPIQATFRRSLPELAAPPVASFNFPFALAIKASRSISPRISFSTALNCEGSELLAVGSRRSKASQSTRLRQLCGAFFGAASPPSWRSAGRPARGRRPASPRTPSRPGSGSRARSRPAASGPCCRGSSRAPASPGTPPGRASA